MSAVMQIRMHQSTIQQADKLMEKLKAPSRSDVVRRAVDISEMLIYSIEQGDRIYIENSAGTKKEIFIPGISHVR